MIVILLVLGLLALFLLRVPVAFALLAVSLAYILFLSPLPPTVGVQRMVSGVDSFVLIALPLFILGGNLMNSGGLTQRMLNATLAYVGRVKGGLAQTNIGVSLVMGGVSGSAVADASALGSMLIPAMRKGGYTAPFSSALTASSAVIGPLIPPSIPMIVIATTAGLGVGEMFLAGAVPGIVLALGLSVATMLLARKYEWPLEAKANLRAIFKRTAVAVPALVAPAIIVGGILSGVFTPTEAASILCVYALVVGVVIYRNLGIREMFRAGLASAMDASGILIIMAAAAAFGYVLTIENVPQLIATALEPLYAVPWLFLLLINILLLLLGMFMEALAVIILLTPILMPAVLAAGIDPVHFATLVVVNLMIGVITPPLGVVMFITNRIAGVTVGDFLRANTPYFVVFGIVLLLVTYVPLMTTWLPGLLAGP